MNTTIDINCDLGESVESAQWQLDAKLMPYISSCNIACGGHAGNIESISVSIDNALKNNISIGAHPSYPDKENFGRKSLNLSVSELRQTLSEQILTVEKRCHDKQTTLSHVKPHGALYNDAATDLKLAMVIAEEVARCSTSYKLFGLAESEMYQAAQRVGIDFVHEGFMDRNYQDNKTLVQRSEPNALHSSLDISLRQALQLAKGEAITTANNSLIKLQVDSICLHGDNPDAQAIAKQLHDLLRTNDIGIAAVL